MTHPTPSRATPSRAQLLTGRILSSIAVLFLVLDSAAKLFRPQPVVEGTLELGYPESCILPLGFLLLACTLLYALPRTAVLVPCTRGQLVFLESRHLRVVRLPVAPGDVGVDRAPSLVVVGVV